MLYQNQNKFLSPFDSSQGNFSSFLKIIFSFDNTYFLVLCVENWRHCHLGDIVMSGRMVDEGWKFSGMRIFHNYHTDLCSVIVINNFSIFHALFCILPYVYRCVVHISLFSSLFQQQKIYILHTYIVVVHIITHIVCYIFRLYFLAS